MDIEHPSSPSFHEPGRQHPHEARQAQELDAALGQDGVERLLEGFPGGVGLVVDDERLDAGEPRLVEPAGIGPVRHDEVDVSREIRARAASISAAMLDPRPEMRMATRRGVMRDAARTRGPDALAAFVGDDFADVDRPSPTWPSCAMRASARSAGAKAIMPMPQLKVRSISASATPPVCASQRKTGGTTIASRSSPTPTPSGSTRGMLSGKPRR